MRRLRLFVVPTFLFCIGLAAGAWFCTPLTDGSQRWLARSAVDSPLSAAGKTRGFSSGEEKITTIMSALTEEEPLLRTHRLYDLLSGLDSGQMAVLFDRAVLVDDSERRGMLLGAVLNRWGAIDPARATEAVRPYRDRLQKNSDFEGEKLDAVVTEAWTRAMPEAALAEAMAHPKKFWAPGVVQNAIEALGPGAVAHQLDLFARTPASSLRDQMCEEALMALADTDPAGADARLSLLSDAATRLKVQAHILSKLSEVDPAAGLARLITLAPELSAGRTGIRLLSGVFDAAAKKDPAAALAALDGMPDNLYPHALASVLVGWAGEHPADALEWAASHGVDANEIVAPALGGPQADDFWRALLDTAFGSHRAETLAWLRLQPASPERDAMLSHGIGAYKSTVEQQLEVYAELTPEGQNRAAGQLTWELLKENNNQAEAWISALPPSPARVTALKNLGFAQAKKAPERADALLEAWPASPDRDALLAGITKTLVFSGASPRALEFARRIGNQKNRERAFETIATNWLGRDQPAARAWLASTTDLSAEQKRVILRQIERR